jgi:hypothetical protein
MTFSVVDIMYAICSELTKKYGGRKWPKMESIAPLYSRRSIIAAQGRLAVLFPMSLAVRARGGRDR